MSCATVAAGTFLAGKLVRIHGRFPRFPGTVDPIEPSTATVRVTELDGETTAVTPAAVTYDADQAVLVDADWQIPADHAGGRVVATIAVAGNLVDVLELAFDVTARVAP